MHVHTSLFRCRYIIIREIQVPHPVATLRRGDSQGTAQHDHRRRGCRVHRLVGAEDLVAPVQLYSFWTLGASAANVGYFTSQRLFAISET